MRKLIWLKSSFSDAGGNNCIEIAVDGHGIAIRESTEPDCILATRHAALRALIDRVKAGEYDHL